MSKIEVDTIDTQSSTTLQVGSTNTSLIKIGTSGDTVEYPAGTTFTQSGTQNVTSGGAINVKSGGSIIIESGAAITNNGTATGFSADLTNLNATNLTSGTVPDARFPATLPAANGSALTNLNATNLGSGTVPDARFPATLPAISGANLTNLPAGGGFVKLQTQTAGSDVSNIVFTSTYLTSTYLKYFVTGSVISAQTPGSSSVYFQLLPSINNGSNYNLDIAGFGEGRYNNISNNSSGESTGGFQYGSGDNRLAIMGSVAAGNQTAMLGMVSFSGYVINSPNYSKTRSSQYFGTANRMYAPNNSDYYTMPTYSGGTSFESGSAWNNLKFQFSAGNISAGSTITLFGVSQ